VSIDGLNNFLIKEIYSENDKAFRSVYSHGNTLLRVEVLSQSDEYSASQYITASISQIKGLFADSLAPYPGTISKTITCENKFQPTFYTFFTQEKLELTTFIAYLNSNLTYGTCTEDQAINKGVSAYFYCPKNKLSYRLELIAPVNEFELSANTFQKMIESIKCK